MHLRVAWEASLATRPLLIVVRDLAARPTSGGQLTGIHRGSPFGPLGLRRATVRLPLVPY
ncbi:hypothetical protein [Streptomyces sp. NPDC052496]|uniref:hypothetical protein n=1 Tax=Streptomyces sp. NPDC052496 TaxID=3154951 RepID=UPI003415A129